MPNYNFWNERWLNNQIGFHQSAVHESLVEFIDCFKGHKKVLVPLCGKSLDMLFLREHGLHVYGVEFSEVAIIDFIEENNLKMSQRRVGEFTVYSGENIDIYQGDFFLLPSSFFSEITACYDRASMVAFNRDERIKYAHVLCELALDLKTLLAPIFNCGEVETGPPYSVVEQEIRDLYGNFFELTKLKTKSFPLRDALKERGAMFEEEINWFFSR